MCEEEFEKVTCLICKKYEARCLIAHLRWTHKMTVTEYKKKYIGAETHAPDLKAKARRWGAKGARSRHNRIVAKLKFLTQDQLIQVMLFIDGLLDRSDSVEFYYDQIRKAREKISQETSQKEGLEEVSED